MKQRIRPKAIAVAAILAAGILAIVDIGYVLLGPASLTITVAAAVFVTLMGLFEARYRLRLDLSEFTECTYLRQCNESAQLEAFVSLVATFRPEWPLPPMRGWAVSPDFARIVIDHVMKRRPEVIVELGSGVSTLLISYALKRLGWGTIVSIDHHAGFGQKTADDLVSHKLGEWARVIHAPLKTQRIARGEYTWYDVEAIERALGDQPVDMVVVDGPPEDLQQQIRFPAVPVLARRLRPGAVVIMDDARTADEAAIAEAWTKEFGLSVEKLPTEKGTYILTVNGTAEMKRAAPREGVHGFREADSEPGVEHGPGETSADTAIESAA